MSDSEVIFLTGAGSGIGRASAFALADRGAALALFDLSEVGLAETAAALRDADADVFARAGDVSDPEAVERAVAEAETTLGPLSGAVACAGVEALGTIPEMDLADWHRVVSVNLTGVFHTARYAIPKIVDAGGGPFVAMSSDAGIQGAAGFGAYCATKHGVIGLVKSLALDHGPQGVRCNAVCPGFVETPMADRIFADLPPEERERWQQTVPLGRFASPQDVAAAIAHLTSDQAGYVNGHAYVVDGGATAGYPA